MGVIRNHWQYWVFAIGVLLMTAIWIVPQKLNEPVSDETLRRVMTDARLALQSGDAPAALAILTPEIAELETRFGSEARALYGRVAAQAHGVKDAYWQDVLREHLRPVFRRGEPLQYGPALTSDLPAAEAVDALRTLLDVATAASEPNEQLHLLENLALLQPTLEDSAHDAMARLLVAQGAGRLDEALAQWQAGLDELPKWLEADDLHRHEFDIRLRMADAALASKSLERATVVLQDMLTRHAGQSGIEGVYLRLGDIAQAQGRLDEAMTLYDRAASYPYVNETILRARLNHAESLRRSGRIGEAILALQALTAPEIDAPIRFAALLHQAEAVLAEGDQPRAVRLQGQAMRMLVDVPSLVEAARFDLGPLLDALVTAAASTRVSDTETYQTGIDAIRHLADSRAGTPRVLCLLRLADLYADLAGRLSRLAVPGEALPREARERFITAADQYKAIADMTGDPEIEEQALYAAGVNYWQGGYPPASMQMLERFLARSENTAQKTQAKFLVAKCLRSIGDFPRAIALFADIQRAHPYQVQAYESLLEIAKCYEQAFQYDLAATYYQKVFRDYRDPATGEVRTSRITPDSAVWREAEFGLSRLYFLRGMSAEARAALEKFIARYTPDDGSRDLVDLNMAHFYLGQALYAIDQFEAAVPHFDYVSALDAEFQLRDGEFVQAKSLFRVGDCYYRLGRYAEAIAAYERALARYSLDLESAWGYFQIGNACRQLGQKAEAARNYDKALFIFPNLDETKFEAMPAGFDRAYWEQLYTWTRTLAQ